jgi:hypothetical protein
MSIVGYAAASGIFLDIHPFLRGLAQSLDSADGPELQLSPKMYAEVDRIPDFEDPTKMVDLYYDAWWTQSKHWKTSPPVLVDKFAAMEFHVQKVSLMKMYFLTHLTRPNTQYGRIRGPYPTRTAPGPPPPRDTLAPNPCKSRVCKERLRVVVEENRKASAVARTMQMALENERVAATRHIQHLKALRKYMLDIGRASLNDTDCSNLLFQAGDDAVLEVPSDSEPEIPQRKKKSATGASSAGPSVTTGPSTNRSRALTPESVSSFDDSSSEFIPDRF